MSFIENVKSHPGEKVNKWCVELLLNVMKEYNEQNEFALSQ